MYSHSFTEVMVELPTAPFKKCYFFSEMNPIVLSVPLSYFVPLTYRLHFSIVYTFVYHKNGIIKCSIPKWNHEPLGEWFHCNLLDILWCHFGGL